MMFLAVSTCTAVSAGELDHAIGKALFERAWIPAPASTRSTDGLGPAFNARSCAACHPGLGRASIGSAGRVVRLSDAEGRPDPVYGSQIQEAAVPGHRPEGRIDRGAPTDLAYGPLRPNIRSGLRLAPGLHAVGLLAAIPDETILRRADPDDADGDGISGRANILADGRIGRFGWKAAHPSLRDQVAAAFSLDMGLSSARRPAPEGDCLAAACRAGPHGGTPGAPEMTADIVRLITGFLAAQKPSAPPDDPRGEALFAAAGCADCHAPESGFTDLLLHDMGPALDGGATAPGVLPTEWRTAPLRGLSGTNEPAALLHDGRAESIATAARLHGGEADNARKRFDALPEEDRARLIRYLQSL